MALCMHVQRRVNLMAEEGVTFVTNAHVGRNVDIRAIRDSADAVVLAAGATKPRDLPIEGRCAPHAVCIVDSSVNVGSAQEWQASRRVLMHGLCSASASINLLIRKLSRTSPVAVFCTGSTSSYRVGVKMSYCHAPL